MAASGWTAFRQTQFFHHAKVHQSAGQPEDDDEQSQGSQPQHPVWSFPRLQSSYFPLLEWLKTVSRFNCSKSST